MRTRHYMKGFFSIILLLSIIGAEAQESVQKFPAQISVYYPIGTQGRQSIYHQYNFSLNLFTGKVAGIAGLEIGGILNQVEGNVSGVQVSGIGNVIGGYVSGIQVGGLGNISGNSTGIQIGGLVNLSGEISGIQVGGLANVTGNVNGIQVGGLANISKNVQGIQIGGLANVTENMKGIQIGLLNVSEDVKGIQLGGLINVAGDVQGIHLAGIFNASESVSGLQLAGIANVTENSRMMQIGGITNITEKSQGFQLAGINNITGEAVGVNFAGIYNRTGILRGFQFGLVSVNDTIASGISMSLINIVKKGFYDEWSLSFSDYVNVELNYKAGIKRFYTIYSIGANFIEDQLWVTGIGFGNRTSLGNRLDFQPELMYYIYYPDNFKDIEYTASTHLKLGFIYKLNSRFGIKVAPSFYVLNADRKDGHDYYKVSPVSSFYTDESSRSKTELGIGISVGLIFSNKQ